MKNLLHVGVHDSMSSLKIRAIILTNTIALIAGGATSIYFVFLISQGWAFTSVVMLITTICLLSIIILNALGFDTLSRFILSLAIPAAVLVIVFVPRIPNPGIHDYVRSPGMVAAFLATSVIPVLIFSSAEKKLMFTCVALSFLCFASLDALMHRLSNHLAFPTLGQYYTFNLSLQIAYVLLVASVMSLKNIVSEFEVKNEELIENLNQKNIELENSNRGLNKLNRAIELQNQEIQAQSEELIQGQESLMLAHNEIGRQKIELEKSLDEKSRDLMHSNQQLINQNNELQQFSYTVSHNLRGPVASLLGLIHIHHLSKTQDDRDKVLTLIEQSARSLETIIRDLNKIVDIRHDKFSAYEKVTLETELLLISESLKDFIVKNDVELFTDFQCREITSIKAYINSILYNLVSNAIQYRSPERRPVINVSSLQAEGQVKLIVSDNGLGIDLSQFGADIFKLYKRFHLHTQGKGLGLYLVKQQIEKLNGTIEINSRPDHGATFIVTLPMQD